MASKPVQRDLLALIENTGGWEAIWERVASGENLTSIAKSFDVPNHGSVSQGFLSRVIYLDPERVTAFKEAKKHAATYYAERQQQVIDECPTERDAIAKAREQAAGYRWSAKVWDRLQFGEESGLNVNIHGDVNMYHLDALRHRIVELPRPVQVLTTGTPMDEEGATD